MRDPAPSIDILRARAEDYQRHLIDLRTDSYEGAEDRADRAAVFRAAAAALEPVALAVLGAFNEVMLAGTGDIASSLVEFDDGGLEARWELSWPGQRAATHRLEPGKPVGPVTIRAHLPIGWTHGHLSGSDAGHWPMQVVGAADAERQWLTLWSIAEMDLHHRIWESRHPWDVVPLPTGDAEPAAKWG